MVAAPISQAIPSVPSHEDRLSSGNCFFCLDKGHWWLSCLRRQRCCTKDFCWTKAIISVCCSSAIWILALGFVSLRLSPVEGLGRAYGNSSRRLLSRLNCRPAWITCKYFTKHCEFFASPSHRPLCSFHRERLGGPFGVSGNPDGLLECRARELGSR
jgi:hypothetical protein